MTDLVTRRHERNLLPSIHLGIVFEEARVGLGQQLVDLQCHGTFLVLD